MSEANIKPAFTELREKIRNHPLIQTEIPIEHALSLPLPTKRWGEPAYAVFASPACRIKGEPQKQGAPDRWFLIDPDSMKILLYARYATIPFSEIAWESVILPQMTLGISELRDRLEKVADRLNELAPQFFEGVDGNNEEKAELNRLLEVIIPQPLFAQYQALVPDFFAWLKSQA